MFTLRPGIDEERREGGREIKQVFCVGFEVALGAQLRVPRKQRLGGGCEECVKLLSFGTWKEGSKAYLLIHHDQH